MRFLIIGLSVLALSSCSTKVSQETVSRLDLGRYAGEWHEIGRLPNFFERDVVAAKARYGVREQGGLTVENVGVKGDGELSSITGEATLGNATEPGKLKVRFDRFPANLFAGDYWVLAISDDYQRAMVGSPSQKFLWLLSKDPNDDREDFYAELRQADALGYPISEIIFNPKRVR